MLKNILMLFICAGGFLISAESQALDQRPPWKILAEALTYLHGVPEVAWVKFEDHKVLIGWRGMPRKFARINKTAARTPRTPFTTKSPSIPCLPNRRR